ncbi:ABC transporter ATP-binding protein (plasmid) [Pedobacter sp. BS3]|uniref:ABC transporter ATP-binding protein n=1 Tax=Pedobacter sp. BS3 TaxID=2567937 RepID=UPI0011EF1984|nr:ABC transporter ATP-binding protein [Pedobacter sp. BS3]TZF85745.1 ABC transporter ATP-binding protein [Pedobacter sp. BS3]
MQITLNDIGRRFNRDWIFRNINYTFISGSSYAILGPNGSGKSTLLQIIAGSLSASAGTINYHDTDREIEGSHIFNYLSVAAPYLELIEEFTLAEQIDFHFRFKKFYPGVTVATLIALLGLEKAKHKYIKHFSSGMKQRVRLALAFCSDTPLLLLDEPTSNLDSQGEAWYLQLIQHYTANRLVIIGSNQQNEYAFCDHRLQIGDYK